MHIRKLVVVLVLTLAAPAVFAQLRPWTDFEVSKELWSISLIKVQPNMGNDYLEGIKQTWVASNKVRKELGQIEDYEIYRSELPNDNDVNLFLVVKFKDSSQLEPNRAEYEKFMKAWGEANQERSRGITKDYPAMREVMGEYRVRKIDIK